MTALEAIDRQIEAVEAGEVRPYVIEEMAAPHFHHTIWALMAPSYGGDLNAAKALHEALLPGWTWAVYGDGSAHLWKQLSSENTRSATPARAWLLAILRAHRHQIAAGGE